MERTGQTGLTSTAAHTHTYKEAKHPHTEIKSFMLRAAPPVCSRPFQPTDTRLSDTVHCHLETISGVLLQYVGLVTRESLFTLQAGSLIEV